MPETANVSLTLPGRPEQVVVVRQALTGLAAALALDAVETNDLNTAVTEACNNVVMHAYAPAEGPLEVDVHVLAGVLAVHVRDRGVGMGARHGAGEGAGAGIGLSVMDALAGRVEFSEPQGGGTEVRLEFPIPAGPSFDPIGDDEGVASVTLAPDGPLSMVEVRLAPSALAAAILPRVLSALAARAYFSTDRISDVQLVADVLAANAAELLDGRRLTVGVGIAPRKLELHIGPLQAGQGESLVVSPADALAPAIARLVDSKCVVPGGWGETLELRLVDQR